jgi:hypothetical protein
MLLGQMNDDVTYAGRYGVKLPKLALVELEFAKNLPESSGFTYFARLPDQEWLPVGAEDVTVQKPSTYLSWWDDKSPTERGNLMDRHFPNVGTQEIGVNHIITMFIKEFSSA